MRTSRWSGFLMALLLVQAAPVWAAVDYLLEIEGIPGESTAEGRANTINIESFSFGASNPATIGSGGLSSGKVSFSDISFSKRLDRSSPLLYLNVAQGKPIKKAVLYGRKGTAGAKPAEFYVLTLENVIVTSVQTSGSAGDIPMEAFTLSFAKIQISYRMQQADGTLSAPVQFGWDLVANVPYSSP